MPWHSLGKTGIVVPPLGYGAFKIGRNQKTKYASSYELPRDDEVDRLLGQILDLGMTYIDTAPAYGVSERQIGRAVGHRRREFVLSTKVGEVFEAGESRYDFSEASVRSSLESSLRNLRTDVVDLVFIHANAADVEIQESTEVVAVLQQAKQAGFVRAIGLSAKTPAGIERALDWADVVMVEYHLDDVSCAAVMAQAAARGVGVIVKKGLASGQLPAAQAIEFVLANQHVASLVVGGLNFEHIRANWDAANRTRRV